MTATTTCYPAIVVEPTTRFVVPNFGEDQTFVTFDDAVAAARATIPRRARATSISGRVRSERLDSQVTVVGQ